jgi:adenylate cyclase
MGQEIERKFLVTSDSWRAGSTEPGRRLRQGYVSRAPEATVRVRSDGTRGWITLKGKAKGASRAEYEYEIPLADADELLDRLCSGGRVEKTRHLREWHGLTWEIDVFEGDNAGLVVAEVELEREDQPVDLPGWVGLEVTEDHRYANSSLAERPYRSWGAPSAGGIRPADREDPRG